MGGTLAGVEGLKGPKPREPEAGGFGPFGLPGKVGGLADFTLKMANPPLTVGSVEVEAMSTPGPTGPNFNPELAVNTFSRLAHNDFVRIALLAVLLAATVAFA
jgi:hypothetical protein